MIARRETCKVCELIKHIDILAPENQSFRPQRAAVEGLVLAVDARHETAYPARSARGAF